MTNPVPWHLPEQEAPKIVEEITHDGRSIEIPIYGSVTPDEARWLEFHQSKHGLMNTSVMAIADAVYGLLLLRFKVAVFAADKLVPLKGKLPAFEEVMCEGDPPRLLPSKLLLKVYFFFIDELNECLGEDRGMLATLESEKAGKTTTGDSSNTTPDIPDLPESLSDNAQSTSSKPLLKPEKSKELMNSTI